MWNIDKIKIRNFRSFLDEEYVFNQDRTTLIFGINRNQEHSNSNGAGKSSFVKSIEFALFGIVNRTMPKEEYIHNDEKECSVTLWLKNQTTNSELIVKRVIFRSKNKAAKVSIFVNGIENKELINEQEANQFIENVLRINKEDLLNYFIVGQSNQMSFLRTTDARQKEIIARFANVDYIEPIITNIKQSIELLSFDLKNQENERQKLNGKIELLNEQIASISLESQKDDLIESMRLQLKEFESNNLLKIHSHQCKIDDIQKEINKFDDQLIKIKISIKSHNKEIDSEIQQLQIELKLFNQELLHIAGHISGRVLCPNCNFSFSLGGEKKSIEQLEKEQLELEESVNSKIACLQELEQLNELQKQEVRKSKTLFASIENLKLEIEEENDKIKSINRRIQIKREEFDKVHSERAENSNSSIIKKLKENLKLHSVSVLKINESIRQIETEIDKYKFWLLNFGIKGFKTFLINRVLNVLQGNINKYLSKVSEFQVKIEGYKTLTDGTIRDKISILVSRDGETWEHYEKFSGGQQTRIDICAVLALRRILNQNAIVAGGGLNFLGLDEAFDGLDVLGQQHVIQTLESIKETCVVISHSNENTSFEHRLLIEYENGISKILRK